jgi:general secretion pathway protein F
MSGTLPNVLQSLSLEYVYVNDIKNKYIGAMAYPAILLIISFVAIITLFLFVLPNIFSIADSFQNVQMPLMTQILRNFSLFLQNQWQWLA